MNHADFVIGGTFWCSDRQWRCTDIGTRTIIAIRIDAVEVGSNVPELRRTLSRSEAEAEGWFNGPPYAVAESVFDENDMEACSHEADADGAEVPPPQPEGPPRRNLYERIRASLDPLGGADDLEVPPRVADREPRRFPFSLRSKTPLQPI